MDFIGPDLPTQESSTGFPQEIVLAKETREGEIREAQRITRIMKDLVDADKIPLTSSREVLLQSEAFQGRLQINNEARMRNGIERYNNYINDYNNDMRRYLSIFDVPTTTQQ